MFTSGTEKNFILFFYFSEVRDTASPRANMWGAGGLLLEDSTEVRPSRATRSPERDLESAPSLSEAASAIVKEEVDGEAAVVASAQEPLPILALDDDDVALWDIYLHGDGPPQASAASTKPNLKDMLVTPVGSKKASVQLNTEAEQVRNKSA